MESTGELVAQPKVTDENMATVSSHISDAERVSSSHDDSKSVKGDTAGNVADLAQAVARGLQPPEIIARLTPDQRLELEKRLVRKIDYRLLPMIILMCEWLCFKATLGALEESLYLWRARAFVASLTMVAN
jgi:hypothetical protein